MVGAGLEQNKSDESDFQWISLVAFTISTFLRRELG